MFQTETLDVTYQYFYDEPCLRKSAKLSVEFQQRSSFHWT